MLPVIVATCNLNQWSMDFEGNLRRICSSISKARERNATYRIGPELETSGYGCEDHFFELDTFRHSWECIASIISGGHTDDILVDIGAPVMHRGVPYNCRVLILNRELLLVRPKIDLADDGNYRESRWFRAWNKSRAVEEFSLPDCIRAVCRNKEPRCQIGNAIVQLRDGIEIGCETCEELWTPRATHIDLSLHGVDIVGNGSGSHHVLRKLENRIDLICSATRKAGGLYLYSNQIGCDGGRLYYDGSALIVLNGHVLGQGSQFTIANEVEVITAVVDLGEVRSFRMRTASRGVQAAESQASSAFSRIRPSSDFRLGLPSDTWSKVRLSQPVSVKRVLPQEEIAFGPACWLWDYLRRAQLNGFFLPLSGGADSAATAAIVGSMCQLLVKAASDPNSEQRLLEDIRTVMNETDTYVPKDPAELAGRILHTAYMGNKDVSGAETKERAANLAHEIGCWHVSFDINLVVMAILGVFRKVFNQEPRYKTRGGSTVENLALQNVQARVRMVLAYLFAQLSLWGRGQKGSLLVLGSSNVDEGLRGYLTKYDCSSADINPIGGISKTDLKEFLRWASSDAGLGYHSLKKIVSAAPTAELEPSSEEYQQTDEDDMGMTYEELSWYGRLRKLGRCGPLAMYEKLWDLWQDRLRPSEVALKVKYFFRMYSINRHKLTTLTPSYHAEDYSPEDNRFDLRQFLYNVRWTWQFGKIDERVASEEQKAAR